jgi:hypothetical protein
MTPIPLKRTPTREVDERWTHALDGLRCLAFVARDDERQRAAQSRGDGTRDHHKTMLPYEAEITGVDGFHVFVVLPDEHEPRRIFWTDIRPLASEEAR